ncbi:MAG: HAD family phosphatase [Marinoscillum sp.]
MNSIKTIIFDLGGVLIDWNPRYLYRKMFEDESEMEHFLSEVCHGDWNMQQDAGRPFRKGVDELVKVFPKYEKEIQAYWNRWIEMIAGEIMGTVEIINQISAKGYPLYALTNWSSETFPLVRNDYAFFDLFEGIVVSGDEKMAKPDLEFYKVLLDRYHIKAENSLFIDDNEPNIRAAEELGFQTIHFKSPKQLIEELRDLSIL